MSAGTFPWNIARRLIDIGRAETVRRDSSQRDENGADALRKNKPEGGGMKKLLFRTLVPETAIGICFAGPSGAATAPPPAKAKAEAAYHPPRKPDGHPDLSGVWQVLNTAGDNVEPHIATA